MIKINSDLCHDNIIKNTKQQLAFDKNKNLEIQRKELKNKLIEIMGLDVIKLNSCPENLIIESQEQKEGYKLIRFVYESEKDMFVPAYLLIPTTNKKKYPVAITLQGHKSGGMYNSIGIVKDEDDEEYQPRGAFALQAVKNGFAALCVELRGMSGELQPSTEERMWGGNCLTTAMMALTIGRTLLGERCWDISRAIDLLPKFQELDTDNVIITGNSGGGTMSFYSACIDERIKLSVPSCAFCTYQDSILHVMHCTCNYMPNMYKYFDMQDLALLIAPRKLVIVCGKEDMIFPLDGVKKGFETVKEIYRLSNAEENLKLVVTPKGHYWCEDIVWKEITDIIS